jgi:uncharacterized membrane protein
MLELLKEKNRLNETIFMGTLSILCFSFSVFRYIYSDTRTFLFLNWNLFLAFLPWALTSLALIKPNIHKAIITIFLLLGTWLLFFPNAPYILTDLFHLRNSYSMPVWFDLILILSFAWTGLLFGLLSLFDIEEILNTSIKPFYVKIVSIGLLFLGSFGIYMGRFLRWNSWDIITEPFSLIYDIKNSIINPFSHLKVWGFTIFMGLFLNMVYWSLRLIRSRK